MRFRQNTAGMTLVEVIVSIGILATAILMFLVIIGGATNIMKRGADLDQSGSASSEALEIFDNTSMITSEEGSVTLNNGDNTKSQVTGSYQSVTVDDVTFTLFVPNSGKDG